MENHDGASEQHPKGIAARVTILEEQVARCDRLID
jgi:hypothetical protein